MLSDYLTYVLISAKATLVNCPRNRLLRLWIGKDLQMLSDCLKHGRIGANSEVPDCLCDPVLGYWIGKNYQMLSNFLSKVFSSKIDQSYL